MSTDLGLFPPRTKRPHRAGRTKRLARHATAAPVGSQKMARERPLPLRKYVSQLVVELEWVPEVESDLGIGIGFLELADDLLRPRPLDAFRLSHWRPP